jgi:hypothetical protein
MGDDGPGHRVSRIGDLISLHPPLGRSRQLARTRIEMVQSVDPTVERSLRGPQDFEFIEVMRPRPAEPIKASGRCAALTGRTHDCKRPACTIQKNVLAKLGPSTQEPTPVSVNGSNGKA